MPSDPPDIETLATRIVYESRWMRLREDRIRYRDGSDSVYGVVEKSDFVAIVPVDEGRRVHLVQQYRYAVRGRYWEIPQGAWEGKTGADPLEVARGELREETGLEATQMIHAGHLFEACPVDREHEEQDMVTRDFSLAEVERMIREGEIKDATTVAALGLLRLKSLL